MKAMNITELKRILMTELRKGGRVSGEETANRTGFSRTYVWKAVKELRAEGNMIEASPNCGYRLIESADVISPETLRKHLCPELKGIRLEIYDTADSTNNVAMRLAGDGCEEWTLVIAREQTAGRGRNGHTFFSPLDTGLYMSVVLRPAIAVSDAALITAAAAVAVAKALEKICGVKTGIKWVNDVYVGEKKVCGILAEAAIEPGKTCLRHAVLGIGVNLLPPRDGFPDDIKDKAAHVAEKSAKELKSRVIAEIMNGLYEYGGCLSYKSYYNDYKKRCFFLGKEVTFVLRGEEKRAVAADIGESFELIVKTPDGKRLALNSGEISVKL